VRTSDVKYEQHHDGAYPQPNGGAGGVVGAVLRLQTNDVTHALNSR